MRNGSKKTANGVFPYYRRTRENSDSGAASEYDHQCLACGAEFIGSVQENHNWEGKNKWLFCPVCGVNWRRRHRCKLSGMKWYDICRKHGREYSSQVTVPGWAIERRWIDHDGKAGDWEHHHWTMTRESAMRVFQSLTKESQEEKEALGGAYYWEYRMLRKIATPCWASERGDYLNYCSEEVEQRRQDERMQCHCKR